MKKTEKIVMATHQGNPRCVTQPFVIVGCIIEKENKFLLIHQNGKWNYPSGWLELEEDIMNGAKREAEEETGLGVEIKDLLGIYPLVKYKNKKILHSIKFIFRARLNNKAVKSKENLRYKWFDFNQIKKMKGKFWDPDAVSITRDAKAGINYNTDIILKTKKIKSIIKN